VFAEDSLLGENVNTMKKTKTILQTSKGICIIMKCT